MSRDHPAYVLAAVDELVYGHHAVFVLVHLLLETQTDKDAALNTLSALRNICRCTRLKEDFHVLTGRLLFEDGVCAFSHHVVDGLHDIQHFLRRTGNLSVHHKHKQQRNFSFCLR